MKRVSRATSEGPNDSMPCTSPDCFTPNVFAAETHFRASASYSDSTARSSFNRFFAAAKS
jgi:hypothetical protein